VIQSELLPQVCGKFANAGTFVVARNSAKSSRSPPMPPPAEEFDRVVLDGLSGRQPALEPV